MLESLQINSVATFCSTGVQIDGLKPINFVYGANGSGKTTISNFLATDNPQGLYPQCGKQWKGESELEIIVYNKQFKEDNFKRENIDGVFTLGKATKEEKEAIAKLVEQRDQVKADGIKKKESLDKLVAEKESLITDYKERFWKDIYKRNEVDFKEAFKGYLKRDSFMQRVLDQEETTDDQVESSDDLKEKSKTIFGEVPLALDSIQEIDFSKLHSTEGHAIWDKKIIGKQDVPISKLIQHFGNNDWVNEGRTFLTDDEDICPFCQEKTVTEKLRKELDDFFDKSFVEDTATVKSLYTEYKQEALNIIHSLEGIATNEKAKKNSKLDWDKYSALTKTLESQLNSNVLKIESKVKEPSRQCALENLASQTAAIGEQLTGHNQEVAKHNKIVENYDAERTKLIASIWKTVVHSERPSVAEFIKKRDGVEKGISALTKQKGELLTEWKKVDSDIREANKNVTSVQPAVDEINRILKAYCFDGFEIVPSTEAKNSYCIKRPDGQLAAETLSEGEITFITFLYYLQRANGGSSESNVNTPRVLVIDDPISSLDSNVLYVVSSLIKDIFKNIRDEEGSIRQVILLTHNVFFHKEVSFINGRSNGCNKTHFWILRKKSNITSIKDYEMTNPIETSYELLWREVKEHMDETGRVSLTIQNTLRRIIENYFKILGKMGDDDLISKFPTKEEQDICRSLLCWINDGSHTVPDDLHIQYEDDSTERYLDVFKNIFKHTDNMGHYEMMIKMPNSKLTQNPVIQS